MNTTRSLAFNPFFLLSIVLSGFIALYAFGLPTATEANDPEGTCGSVAGCNAEDCAAKNGDCAKKGCGCGCQK